MKRIRPTTKKKLLQAIELLHEVDLELREAKPFYARICRCVAEALQDSMQEHCYARFLFDIPHGPFRRFMYSPYSDHNTPNHVRAAILEIALLDDE